VVLALKCLACLQITPGFNRAKNKSRFVIGYGVILETRPVVRCCSVERYQRKRHCRDVKVWGRLRD